MQFAIKVKIVRRGRIRLWKLFPLVPGLRQKLSEDIYWTTSTWTIDIDMLAEVHGAGRNYEEKYKMGKNFFLGLLPFSCWYKKSMLVPFRRRRFFPFLQWELGISLIMFMGLSHCTVHAEIGKTIKSYSQKVFLLNLSKSYLFQALVMHIMYCIWQGHVWNILAIHKPQNQHWCILLKVSCYI